MTIWEDSYEHYKLETPVVTNTVPPPAAGTHRLLRIGSISDRLRTLGFDDDADTLFEVANAYRESGDRAQGEWFQHHLTKRELLRWKTLSWSLGVLCTTATVSLVIRAVL